MRSAHKSRTAPQVTASGSAFGSGANHAWRTAATAAPSNCSFPDDRSTTAYRTRPAPVTAIKTRVVRAAGLPELVAESEADYEALVLHLAQNPAALAAQRARVAAARQAPPFDTPRFTAALEAACHAMVERHRAGLPPEHLDIG